MRRVFVNEVEVDSVLAIPIYNTDGKILLHKGVKLNSTLVKVLRKKGIKWIYIEDKYTTDIKPTPFIHDEVRQEAVNRVYNSIKKLTQENIIQDRVSTPDLGEEYQKIFKEILDSLVSRQNLLVNLTDLFISDGYFFHHSINVATLAGIIGIAKGYTTQQLNELGVGALLFDIGMTQIPTSLWNKQGILNDAEREILQSHTVKGFELLKKQPNISLLSAHCALQHHERVNQNGYPRQLQEDDIHEYAKIVAIADVYDALISSRNYRKQYSPQEAAEYLSAAGGHLFDFELVKIFLKNIAIYPISTTVKLNTGHIGVVSKIYPDIPLRPMVRIIKEPNGEEVKSTYEIDLKKEYNVTIVESL